MLDAADAIERFLSGQTLDTFVANDLVRSAVLQKLTVIGEAASCVTKPTKQRFGELPWRDIAAFRNIAVHKYFGVDWPMVWDAARVDVPELRTSVERIFAAFGREQNDSA